MPLPPTTPGRKRNVPRYRCLGGDSTCVSPNFNEAMIDVWEELREEMPQSGRISTSIHQLLQKYKDRCNVERKRQRQSDQSHIALLPVSFALAKDWIISKKREHSEALQQMGTVNEEARRVVSELTCCLLDQSTSTARLLDQDAS